ncbi:unnamed protein product [Arctia plantaginis]|uniref:Uncharacterized protein n=1 Tax=Arctia plantaginis TaxID=874455 RepID=A0A8S0YU54_ARCPL|nr:unnamed protein product [Arctia plantaginis]
MEDGGRLRTSAPSDLRCLARAQGLAAGSVLKTSPGPLRRLLREHNFARRSDGRIPRTLAPHDRRQSGLSSGGELPTPMAARGPPYAQPAGHSARCGERVHGLPIAGWHSCVGSLRIQTQVISEKIPSSDHMRQSYRDVAGLQGPRPYWAPVKGQWTAQPPSRVSCRSHRVPSCWAAAAPTHRAAPTNLGDQTSEMISEVPSAIEYEPQIPDRGLDADCECPPTVRLDPLRRLPSEARGRTGPRTCAEPPRDPAAGYAQRLGQPRPWPSGLPRGCVLPRAVTSVSSA